MNIIDWYMAKPMRSRVKWAVLAIAVLAILGTFVKYVVIPALTAIF